jgi:uncharacterized oxidoreductase
MPTVPADRLEKIAATLLQGAGASEEEATITARHSIGANLAGHDSHGIIQIPIYIDRVNKEHIVPGAPFDIIREKPTTTVIDGNWGFGYVVSEKAMQITIDKAKKNGVAATTVFRQSHVGRVADYPLMAAKEGLIGMMTADSGRSPKSVVPFGGREPRLGTNPISIAMPSNLDGPFHIDMATSAAAAGKLKVAQSRGTSIPEGWVLDKDGNPSTDSGILTGLGFGVEPSGRHNDGVFMAAFQVDAFKDLEEFKQEVTEFAAYLKDTPRAAGFDEIFYPGELEYLRTQKGLAEGITVEDATWEKLVALAKEYGVADQLEMS